jgi:hypothetical protein
LLIKIFTKGKAEFQPYLESMKPIQKKISPKIIPDKKNKENRVVVHFSQFLSGFDHILHRTFPHKKMCFVIVFLEDR